MDTETRAETGLPQANETPIATVSETAPDVEPVPMDGSVPGDTVAGWRTASRVAGMSASHLQRLVKEGKVTATKDAMGIHHFRRTDLVALAANLPPGRSPESADRSEWEALADRMQPAEVPAEPAQGELLSFPPPSPPSPPPPQPMPITRRARKAEATTTPQGLLKRGYFRNFLDELLGTGQRLKVWRRGDAGKLQYIRDYTPQDLARSSDIETFLQTYLVPRFGEGEYEVALVGSDGAVSRGTSYVIANPNTPAAAPSAQDQVLAMLERLIARMEHQAEQKKDGSVSERVAEIRAISELVSNQQKTGETKGDQGVVALLSLFLPRLLHGEDSTAVRSELVALKAELARAATPAAPSMPLLPDPTPPIDVAAIVNAVVGATKQQQFTFTDLSALLTTLRPEHKPTFETKDLIALVPVVMQLIDRFQQPQRDAMKAQQEALESLAQAIEELREGKKGTVRDTLEDLKALKEVAADFFRPGDNESFLGFLRRVWDDLPGRLDQLDNLAANIRRKKMGALPQAPARAAEPRAEPRPTPAQGARQRPARFPDGFVEAVAEIAKQQDDPGRIEAALKAFAMLAQESAWKPWVAKALAHAKQNEKDSLLALLTTFISTLAEAAEMADVLPSEVKEATVAAFKTHIDEVAATLAQLA